MVLDLTAEQRSFKASIEQFARETVAPQAARIDSSGEFPLDVMRAAAGVGLLGVTVPTAWGGAGRDYVSYVLGIETIARASATVAASLVVTNSLVAELVAYAGTNRQKELWLRGLAAGEAIGALRVVGARCRHRRRQPADDGRAPAVQFYTIRGRKVWVANAEVARVAIVFAATTIPSSTPGPSRQSRASGSRARGVTAFLIPMDTPGITRRARDESLGVRGLGCINIEFDIVAGANQVLGAVDEGFRLAMWALDGGRVAIAAQALGIGEAALGEAIAHAKTREQFGHPIASFQAIQWMLADSATELAAARLLTWKAADAKNRQERSTLEASMAKLAASEAAHRSADRAMQVLASAGYRRGSVVERLFRDVRATESIKALLKRSA